VSDTWEKMPGMQRVITSDSVIYVHQNPVRRRRPSEPTYLAEDPEPDLEAMLVPEPVAAEPEPVSEPEPEPPQAQVKAETPQAQTGGSSVSIVRNGWKAPPPGYAIEFGTGRLVPMHSFRGRMTFPNR